MRAFLWIVGLISSVYSFLIILLSNPLTPLSSKTEKAFER